MTNLLAPNFDAIPEFLKQEKWGAWAAEPRKNGKIGKPPVGINGKYLQPNNPQNWHTLPQARAFYEANKGKILPYKKGPISGVGILVQESSLLVVIDFDHVLSPNGTLDKWADKIISELNPVAYIEISPSGNGLHAFLYGKKPSEECKGGPEGKLEIYEKTRFLTVTGRKWEGCQDTPANGSEAQSMIDRLMRFIEESKNQKSTGGRGTAQPLPRQQEQPTSNRLLTDSELLNKIRQSKQGQKFRTLYDYGDISAYGNDDSAAEQALCNILASWTGKEANRMDSLMRQSALLRDPERLAKWDRKTGDSTYGEITIAKAIQDCRWCYEEKSNHKKSQSVKNTAKTTQDKNEFLYTEDAIALIFEEKYRDTLRYDHTHKAWYGWNGTYWKLDETGRVYTLIRKVCRNAAKNTCPKESFYLQKASTSSAVNKFAQCAEHMAVTHEKWDADDFLLGTPGGTVDLKSGKLMPGKRDYYITRITSVSPANEINAPIWLQFLDEATEGKKDLQRFMQQIAGMCLTGSTREHAIFFVYGPGGNGKTVFLETLSNILGQYSKTAQMETFTVSNNDRHPAELAALDGARLVTVSETEEGRAWAEEKIKKFSGGDKISARYMRGNPFEFQPKAKLVIIGNHQPELRNVDKAIRRRLNIIPFLHTPQQADAKLSEKLIPEYPAILRWMIAGCLDWQQNGLQRPQSVTDATQEYFEIQDIFGQWLDECCTRHVQFSCGSTKLFNSWKEYAEENGIKSGSQKSFAGEMVKRGFDRIRDEKGKRAFSGITLKSPTNTSNERGCPNDF